MFRPVITLIVSLSFSLFTNAMASELIYLTADALYQPSSDTTIKKPAILIEDGVIKKVSTQKTLTQPSNTKHIDLSGHTILPGLIDMHVHLTGSPKVRGYQSLALSSHDRLLMGVKHAKQTLNAGFTTVRNVGSQGYGILALRDAIAAGDIEGPRMFVAGPPVGITGGHCSDNNLLPSEFEFKGEGVADGPWAMRAKVRQNIKYGVDLIKTCSTGGVFSKGTTLGAAQGSPEELKALVEEAHARGLKVASHAHGATGIKNAIRAGVDTVEHASFLDEEAIALAKEHDVYFSMDIYNTEYTLAEGEKNGVLEESLDKERQVGTVQRESFTKAVNAGVKMLFGSDAAIYPHGDNANQFSRMVRFGMTPNQAIAAATSTAAEALGKADQLGIIAPGAYSDIIAVPGNPLKDISLLENIPFVMKQGTIYKQ